MVVDTFDQHTLKSVIFICLCVHFIDSCSPGAEFKSLRELKREASFELIKLDLKLSLKVSLLGS